MKIEIIITGRQGEGKTGVRNRIGAWLEALYPSASIERPDGDMTIMVPRIHIAAVGPKIESITLRESNQ